MRRSPAALLSLLLCAAPPGAADDPLSPPTRSSAELLLGKALSSSRAFDTLRSLTDGVGPRLAGSAGDRAAVAWALATLKAQGFANVRAEPVKVPRWERGEESGSIVSPSPQKLVLCALGGSVATPAGGLEAEVVEATSLEEVDALGEKAKGKIVFVYKKIERARDGAGYGANAGLRHGGASRAAKVGAVGYLLRSIGTSDERFAHTGAMRYDEGAPRIPAAALANPDADLLHRLLADGKPVRVRFSLACRTLEDVDSANVIGEIPGRETPEEVVLVGGHLDSWDLGTGAIDDGAGCAIVVEAARLIGQLPTRPRRTVRVVLFANEENGLRGGKAYAAAHEKELARHVGAIEADSGGGKAMGFSWNAGPTAAPVLAAVSAVLSALSAGELKAGGDGGADVSSMKASGVPLFGLRNDATRYFDLHHTANDTLDKVDPRELDTGVAAVAVLAYVLADLPSPIERIPPAAPKAADPAPKIEASPGRAPR